MVCTVFGEDFAIGEGIQQGLSTGVNEHFVIGQYEAGIQLAEKAIGDALDKRLVCPQTLTLSECIRRLGLWMRCALRFTESARAFSAARRWFLPTAKTHQILC